MLTYEDVNKVLSYNPENGLLIWKQSANKRYAGKIAGNLNAGGYIETSYRRHRLYGHRVAWLLTNKEWPKDQIDHINGIRDDNRIENLRVVDNKQNHTNMKKHKGNSSGVTGVYRNNRAKKWQAYICVDYKQIYLGVFKYLVDAETARKEAEIKYGFHKNHGREEVVNAPRL